MFPFALKWYFFFIKCTSRENCFHSSVDKIILLYPQDPLFLSWYHAPVSKSPPHMIDFASNIFLIQTILCMYLSFLFCSFRIKVALSKYISIIVFWKYEYIYALKIVLSGLCVCCFLKERKCVVCDRAVIGWSEISLLLSILKVISDVSVWFWS